MDTSGVKLWKDLFNNNSQNNKIGSTSMIDGKNNDIQINDYVLVENIIKSSQNGLLFREKIPQSVIKKSIKSANENKLIKK